MGKGPTKEISFTEHKVTLILVKGIRFDRDINKRPPSHYFRGAKVLNRNTFSNVMYFCDRSENKPLIIHQPYGYLYGASECYVKINVECHPDPLADVYVHPKF